MADREENGDQLTPGQSRALRAYTTADGYERIQASASGREPRETSVLDAGKRERWQARLAEAQRLADELGDAAPPAGWYDTVYMPPIMACWREAGSREELLALWQLAEQVGEQVGGTVGFGYRISDPLPVLAAVPDGLELRPLRPPRS